jgi:hypothetical protein
MWGRPTISTSGHAGPVVVDEGVQGVVDAPAAAHVGRLAGVLLEVGALDPDDGPSGSSSQPSTLIGCRTG